MILLGDCLERLKELPDNSVDSVVTDPPYGLKFMGKKWDYDVPCTDVWREVLRVLRPGGHLLSFGGTRTYHRMVVSIEDAGFEIRDQIQWLYGSGFPKSHDVSKAIDKAAGAEREVLGEKIRADGKIAGLIKPMNGGAFSDNKEALGQVVLETAPATDAAKQWQGWGSALKPANEPIVLARKPLSESTLAKNVLKWGVGGLNIDASRVEYRSETDKKSALPGDGKLASSIYSSDADGSKNYIQSAQGRWPANLLLDEAAAALLDEQSGLVRHSEPFKKLTDFNFDVAGSNTGQKFEPQKRFLAGASRFFYVAKASKRERNAGLDHTTLIWENHAWEKPDLKLALEAMLQLAKDTLDDSLTVVCSWSTELCGLPPTEKSRQDMIFTISTALKLITDLRTLNASQNLIIRENIQDAIKTIEANGLNLAESVASISQLLPNITNEKAASVLGVVHALLPMLSKVKDTAKTNNFHATVKPLKLMEYLIKLVTPPGGTVLDPFMGSGSTGVAAFKNQFKFIGIEMNEEYVAIAEKRMKAI